MIVPDEEVTSVRTLQQRLGSVRTALYQGILHKSTTGLLVSEEWLRDALEKRVLELEHLIVELTGIEADCHCKVCGVGTDGEDRVFWASSALYIIECGIKLEHLSSGDPLCQRCRRKAKLYKSTEGISA